MPEVVLMGNSAHTYVLWKLSQSHKGTVIHFPHSFQRGEALAKWPFSVPSKVLLKDILELCCSHSIQFPLGTCNPYFSCRHLQNLGYIAKDWSDKKVKWKRRSGSKRAKEILGQGLRRKYQILTSFWWRALTKDLSCPILSPTTGDQDKCCS